MDFVPTVDMNSGDVVREVDAAFRRVGFFQLVNHGVSDAVISDMRRGTQDFFALPLPAKLACRPSSPGVNRGYMAKGSESVGYSVGVATPPDRFEAFNVGGGRPAPSGIHPDLVGLFAPNTWPVELPEFPRQLQNYFNAMLPLVKGLLDVFALALDLPPGWFDDKVDRAPDTLRINSYEPRSAGTTPDPDAFGQGPHSDYGVVTVLLADPLPGLQVAGDDGAWHGVIAADGAFIVNAGDLLAQWTNDRWQSSLHRVLPPERFLGETVARRSIPFFKQANADTTVTCLPSCCQDGRPARYPPVVVGEHLLAKLVGTRLRTEARAVSTVGSRAGALDD
jgi:isopenicillin N synthase-like dioxygenase